MIVKEEFLNMLRQYFSLNLYEVKIWTALLSRKVATAGELSDLAIVPRSRTYDVLESLEKKGFVMVKLGKPIKYIAISPKDVIDRVKKRVAEKSEEKIGKLESLRDSEVLQDLEQLHEQGIQLVEPSDLSGALKGRYNLYNHLEAMVKNAEDEVILMTTSTGFLRKVEALRGVFEVLVERGVSIKMATPKTDKAVKIKEELKDVAQIRFTDEIEARFCVIDGEEVLFMTLHDKDIYPAYDIGVWVNTPFFAQALQQLFEVAWKEMSEE
ncbi:MAG: TrmB family transcriptional regulator [Candidatus Nanoarchaeia archaeon]